MYILVIFLLKNLLGDWYGPLLLHVHEHPTSRYMRKLGDLWPSSEAHLYHELKYVLSKSVINHHSYEVRIVCHYVFFKWTKWISLSLWMCNALKKKKKKKIQLNYIVTRFDMIKCHYLNWFCHVIYLHSCIYVLVTI